jgi:hypothetical protein
VAPQEVDLGELVRAALAKGKLTCDRLAEHATRAGRTKITSGQSASTRAVVSRRSKRLRSAGSARVNSY